MMSKERVEEERNMLLKHCINPRDLDAICATNALADQAALVPELVAMLKRMEFCMTSQDGSNFCPVCQCERHLLGCKLATLLTNVAGPSYLSKEKQ